MEVEVILGVWDPPFGDPEPEEGFEDGEYTP